MIDYNAMKLKLTWCVVLMSYIKVCTFKENSPPCFSDIYCHGPLLDTVQMAKVREDSKTFVDMKMKFSPQQTMQYFNNFMKNFTARKPSKTEVEEFVETYFEPEGQEFKDWNPTDWIPHPKFVDNIKDKELKEWAVRLNALWKILGRKLKDDIKENASQYSIIWVPNPVIVPGGRFREFYYWDSYWIIQGLLLSEMYHTVQGMLENFLYIVDQHGHVPNGGRIYYLARSQPPLLIPMVKLYLEFTGDTNFISKNIRIMEKEFDFWMTNHCVNIAVGGTEYTLARYGDKSKGPRPESYSEDVSNADVYKDNVRKEEFYSELKAAAESGWDFSSRWFITNDASVGKLVHTKTRSIIPVDLNSILYWNAKLLAEFHSLVKNTNKADKYNEIAVKWMKAVTAVLWHEEIGSWLDYDIYHGHKRNYFFPSNISPLWTSCYNVTNKDNIVQRVLKYLQKNDIIYPGGVPTSIEQTGEQWDYPNAWPPLQHIMIIGLNNTGNYRAVKLAYELAKKWVRSNFKTYKETDHMYEKYDATIPGDYGGGGEYIIQVGFGWTNGVIMDLLNRYALELTADDPSTKSGASSISSITMARITVLVSLTASFIE